MKRIGITVRIEISQYGSPCDVIEHTYLNLFKKLGFYPVLIPNIEKRLITFLSNMYLDGVVLSGGNDISSEYEMNVMRGERSKINIRDFNEHNVLNWAIENKKPVLGICRGMQFINLYFGGGIVNNLAEFTGMNHAGARHMIRFINNAINVSGKTFVNSYHNQGITKSKLSTSLQVFAMSQDDLVIEGIYHPFLPIIGIQWHPEREKRLSRLDRRLILNLFNLSQSWVAK